MGCAVGLCQRQTAQFLSYDTVLQTPGTTCSIVLSSTTLVSSHRESRN